jgi:ankyrin repeat protein
VVQALLISDIDNNATDNEGWSAWHIAASWRLYDILREILKHYSDFVNLLAQTNEGAFAFQLSQDNDFYSKLKQQY